MLLTHNSIKGQTLIEVLVALSIGILVIGALSIGMIVSIRNSQFSQSQLQATRYAQEGIDLVRNIRDRNGAVTSTNPVLAKFTDLWGYNFGPSSGLGFIGFFKLNQTIPSLTRFDNSTSASETLGGNFSRYIIIEDTSSYTTQKLITSKVSWTDSSGYHESNLQTLITNH